MIGQSVHVVVVCVVVFGFWQVRYIPSFRLSVMKSKLNMLMVESVVM